MKRIYSLILDISLIGIECVPSVIVLKDVFQISIIELSLIAIALFYILNSVVTRFMRLNQTFGDILLKIEMLTTEGIQPTRFKMIFRDLIFALGILNSVNGLFSLIGLALFCLPVGKHKKTGNIIILSDYLFKVYYQDVSIKENNPLD